MENIVDTKDKNVLTFDLKGSTYNRSSSNLIV